MAVNFEREAWRALFKFGDLCSHYITAQSIKTQHSLTMSCKFPFSWVVYEFLSRHIKKPLKRYLKQKIIIRVVQS